MLLLLASFCFTSAVFAQSADASDASLAGAGEITDVVGLSQSPEAMRDVFARLSDREIEALLEMRTVLLGHLEANAESEAALATGNGLTENGLIEFAQFWAGGVVESVTTAFIRVPRMLAGQVQSFKNFVADRGSSESLRIVRAFILAIVAGLVVEWVVRLITRRWHAVVANPVESENLKGSIKVLSLRLLLDMAGLLAFAFVAAKMLERSLTGEDLVFFDTLLFSMIVFPRFMMGWVSFLLAPKRPELRLVHTDDWTAKFIAKHTIGFFLLIGLGTTVISFNVYNGIPMGELRIGFWISLATYAYFTYIAWQARDGLTQMLIGKHNDVTPFEAKIARIYPYLLIGLTVLVWLVSELIVHLGAFHLFEERPQIVTLLIALFAPAFDTLIRALAASAVPPMEGEGPVAEKAYHSTKRSYLRIGRVLVFGVLLMLLTDVWKINFDDVASNAMGASVASHFIKLLVILSIGYLIWEIVSSLINRKLAAEHSASGMDLNSEEPGGGEGGGVGASRLSTILPLLRFTVQTIVITMTILLGLSNIGINVTPLLAGAGVAGIAIGFGAQKLVADVVSGIFFLIDDAFRAGEYVSVEGTVGTIEKISLRSMQLRHHRGGVHTIPYGEIPKLTNYSRDWVMMKLKFTVPFDTDIKKVKKIFKQIGAEVLEIPHLKDDFIQPFKSQGVLEVNDVGLVVGGKFMAKPGTQFMMRKELYQRVQNAFDANGIQFARKEVRVKLDEAPQGGLTEEQRQAIGAAAFSAENDPQDDPANSKK